MSEKNVVTEMGDPRQILQLAAMDVGSKDFAGALERIRVALPELQKHPDFLAPARAIEARSLMSLGREQEALDILDKAAKEAQEAGLERHVTGLRGLRQQLERLVEMRRLALTPVDELSGRPMEPGERAVLFANKIVAMLSLGEIEEAAALLPRARAAAEEADDPVALLPVLLATSQLGAATGDLSSARKAVDAARNLAKLHDPDSMALVEEMARFLKR